MPGSLLSLTVYSPPKEGEALYVSTSLFVFYAPVFSLNRLCTQTIRDPHGFLSCRKPLGLYIHAPHVRMALWNFVRLLVIHAPHVASNRRATLQFNIHALHGVPNVSHAWFWTQSFSAARGVLPFETSFALRAFMVPMSCLCVTSQFPFSYWIIRLRCSIVSLLKPIAFACICPMEMCSTYVTQVCHSHTVQQMQST